VVFVKPTYAPEKGAKGAYKGRENNSMTLLLKSSWSFFNKVSVLDTFYPKER